MISRRRISTDVFAFLFALVVLSSLFAGGFFTTPKAFASNTYTVQAGDTLSSIGLKFGVTWQSIVDANNISAPYAIYPGEVLVIPINDPLATANTTYDKYDSIISSSSQKYAFPDPMMVKSMMMQESAFQANAVSPDTPCGVPPGWTTYQSHSFGLMQVTPACSQPNMVPNLTTNQHSSKWATSWFNPQYNTDRATGLLSGTLTDMMGKFAGCTTNQYTLMAVGGYNSGEGAITGCGTWDARAGTYITAVLGHYQTFAQMANVPDPY